MESLSYIKISSERVEEPIVKAAHIGNSVSCICQ